MRATRLPSEVGNWVDGERFFGREAELRRLIELLDAGANISLIAPRRIGKTSLMREAARQIDERDKDAEDGLLCLHVDLEASHEPADVFKELHSVARRTASLTERALSWAEQVILGAAKLKLPELELKVREHFGVSWQDRADHLVDALIERRGRRIVLFLDEVPILVQRLLRGPQPAVSPAELFLSWLRRAAQRHQGRLSMVVTGSIGLGPMLRRVALSATVNHLTPFELPPWDAETVVACLTALARAADLRFDEGAAEQVPAALGVGIPHHVQLLFARLSSERKRSAATNIRAQDVASALAALGRSGEVFSHYAERLRLAVEPELFPLARDLLTEAAVCGHLSATAAQLILADHPCPGHADPLTELLDILEHDGYLVPDAGGHRFEADLVRTWWAGRFGRNYVPAARRGRA